MRCRPIPECYSTPFALSRNAVAVEKTEGGKKATISFPFGRFQNEKGSAAHTLEGRLGGEREDRI